MRKFLSFLALAAICVSCDPDESSSSSTYPTESLSLSPETNSLLMLEYSTNTSASATADLIRANVEDMFSGNVTHMSLTSTAGDPLYNALADSVSDHFGGKPAMTFLLNGAAKTLPEVQASIDEIQDNISTKPLLSVGHVSSSNDTAWVVDVLVEFFKDTLTPFLFVQTYFLADIEAAVYDAGALDLTLAPNSNLVATDGSQITRWVGDNLNSDSTKVLFPANSTYVHKRIFLDSYNRENVFGTSLSSYSKFGAEFFNGDNIGLRQNPIQHYFLKTDFDHLDFTYTPRFLTVVWNFDFVSQEYTYVNSYMN